MRAAQAMPRQAKFTQRMPIDSDECAIISGFNSDVGKHCRHTNNLN